jgi:hemerythrin
VTVWTTEHATGNLEIDEQHAHIVELINAVDEAATTGAGASTIELVLGLLTRYLAMHFSTEERLMRSVSYPGLPEHAQHHAWCVAELQGLLTKYRSNETSLDTVLQFVRDWLQAHTLTRDQEFAAFTRATASGTASTPA